MGLCLIQKIMFQVIYSTICIKLIQSNLLILNLVGPSNCLEICTGLRYLGLNTSKKSYWDFHTSFKHKMIFKVLMFQPNKFN